MKIGTIFDRGDLAEMRVCNAELNTLVRLEEYGNGWLNSIIDDIKEIDKCSFNTQGSVTKQ